MPHCSHCLQPEAPWICPCHNTYYCNQKCQEADFETHQDMCIPMRHELISIDAKVPFPQPPAQNTNYRNRGFYKASVKLMKSLKNENFFAYMCFMTYKVSPFINFLLFQVNGDFTKFDQKFQGVGQSRARIKAMLQTEKDPYSIFGTFFKITLHYANLYETPLRDKKGKPILTEKHFVKSYPVMKKYLNMKDKAAFVRLFISALQNVIYSIPKLSNPVGAYRGWSPLNLPDTLAMDPRLMYPGQQIVSWGFTSIGLDARVSSYFTDKNNHCCFAHITIPAGFPVFLISSDISDKMYPKTIVPYHQMEILLPVGCVFQVVKPATYMNILNIHSTQYDTIAYVELVLIRINKVKIK